MSYFFCASSEIFISIFEEFTLRIAQMNRWLGFLIFLAPLVAFANEKIYEDSGSSEKEIRQQILPFMKQKAIPGIGIAFFDGKDDHLICYGFADTKTNQSITPDSIFELASITKVFTSTELALQVLRGNMSLNDFVSRYLPDLKGKAKDIKEVTLLQLATHTSGLPRTPPPQKNRPADTHQMVLNFLENWKLDHPKRYLYSNLAFGVLGFAVAHVEKKSFQETINADILRPLEMFSTFIEIPEHLKNRYVQGYQAEGKPARHEKTNAWPGGGALKSTARDMLRFLKANLQLSGPEELQKAMQLAQKGFIPINENLTMGLGWQRLQVDDLLIIDKNGGVPGFSSYIGMIPSKNLGIVLLVNKSKTQITLVGRQILTHFAKKNHSVTARNAPYQISI